MICASVVFSIVIPFHFQILPVPTCTLRYPAKSVAFLDFIVPSTLSLSLLFLNHPFAEAWWPTAPHYPTFSHMLRPRAGDLGGSGDSAASSHSCLLTSPSASESSVLSRLIARQLWPPALAVPASLLPYHLFSPASQHFLLVPLFPTLSFFNSLSPQGVTSFPKHILP